MTLTPTSPDAGANAAEATDATTQDCPPKCLTDFTVTATCRIVRADGGTIVLEASEPASGCPPGTYAWTTSSANLTLTNAGSTRVTVTGGATPSTAVDAETITVTRTAPACPPVQKTVKVTVASVDKIAVTIKATPALTARAGAVAPADHLFDCVETAEAFPADKSLVLMRGDFQAVQMVATVRPPDTPVAWAVTRAPDDAATVGGAGDLPALAVDGANPTQAALTPGARGSFFVRCFTDCQGNGRFEPSSAFRLVPTVLVDVVLQADNTLTSTAGFNATVVAPNVRIQTGSFNIDAVRAGTADAAIYMNCMVDLVSGGGDGRRLLDCVFAGWINNLRSTIRSGEYAGNHVSQIVLATNLAAANGPNNTFRPGDAAPIPPAFPILDTGRNPHGTGGETATLTRSRSQPADRTDLAVGQRWRVEAVDSPGGGQGLTHAFFPGALNRVHHEDNFTAFLAFWTNRGKSPAANADPANRVYGVMQSFQWQVLGEWTVGPAPARPLAEVVPRSVTRSGTAAMAPPVEAHRGGCEVIAPNIFDLLGTDART